jgi:hypothetical protein
LTFFSSCTVEQPSTGILVINVVDSNGVSLKDQQVFLAKSLSDLEKGNYISNKWTDSKGIVYYSDLLPLHYWYGTEYWVEYGGAQVWAGIEHIVTLRVVHNKP